MKNIIRKICSLTRQDHTKATGSNDAFMVQKSLMNSKTPIIFDVGAHVGVITRRYRSLFPQAVIHSFEPFPQSFDQLDINLAKDDNAFTHKVAVSDSKGSKHLNANILDVTNSLLPTSEDGSAHWGSGKLETKDQVEVATTTIDAFCSENDIDRIDILKLDIQGNEFAALTGAAEMLSEHNISLIYTEIIMVPTYQGQHRLHDYLAFLNSWNYDLIDIYNPVRKNKRLLQADFLFAHNSIIESSSLHE